MPFFLMQFSLFSCSIYDECVGSGVAADFLFLKVEVNDNFQYMNEGRGILA